MSCKDRSIEASGNHKQNKKRSDMCVYNDLIRRYPYISCRIGYVPIVHVTIELVLYKSINEK